MLDKSTDSRQRGSKDFKVEAKIDRLPVLSKIVSDMF